MSIDEVAHKLADSIFNDLNTDRLEEDIKVALQSYGDECAREMRDDAVRLFREKRTGKHIMYKIRDLPLPSEKEI